ncbi:MAG TPA: DUF5011 domain-containing protein, partial [Candidatus Hydrogenedentes bacterium]|nr:DUF5011 domain-containing protein [Candidatus Hydrogenedentota bacterium]
NNSGGTDDEYDGQITMVTNNTNGTYFLNNRPNGSGTTNFNLRKGICTNEPVLQAENPYVIDGLGFSPITPKIGELTGVRAEIYGWLNPGYWNETQFVTSPDTGVQATAHTSSSLNFPGFQQIVIRNTSTTTPVSGLGLRVTSPAPAYARKAMLLQGSGQAAGTLQPGQTWTTAIPTTYTYLVVHVPTITVAGDDTVECGSDYTLANLMTGVAASDMEDGDLTGQIVISGDWPVNPDGPGDYVVTFNVTDSDGFDAAPVTKTVHVVDTTNPVITGLPKNWVLYKMEPYTEAQALQGVNATDSCSALNPIVVTAVDPESNPVSFPLDGSSEPSYPAVFTITYNVTDFYGNPATATDSLIYVDNAPPEINLFGANPDTAECIRSGGEYFDPGYEAIDPEDGDITESVVVTGSVDVSLPGTYTLTYTVQDNGAFPMSDTEIRTVEVVDTNPPSLILYGAAEMTISTGGTYTEQGARAEDECEGVLTSSVVIGGDVVDTNTPGDYVVTYNVQDSAGNPAPQLIRTIHVVDNAPPVVSLIGVNPDTVECNEAGTPYDDPGAVAIDPEDGDITDDIVVTGSVNTAVAGPYILTYTVVDSGGVTGTNTRTVNVQDHSIPVLTLNGPAQMCQLMGVSYTEQNAHAHDACEGDMTASVVVGGDVVDINTPGTYVVTYNVQDGAGNSAVPLTRTVDVYEAGLLFTLNPENTDAYVDSDPFDLTATYAFGCNVATYEWTRVPANLGAQPVPVGTNTVTLTVNPASLAVGAYEYYVRVNDAVGSAQSESATVRVANHMFLAEDLEDRMMVDGQNYTWSIAVEDGLGILHYQWFKDDGSKTMQEVPETSRITGTQTDTLSLEPFDELNDVGNYQVSISDEGGETIYTRVANLSAGAGVPAAGLLSLIALAGMTAVGGALSIRRRK